MYFRKQIEKTNHNMRTFLQWSPHRREPGDSNSQGLSRALQLIRGVRNTPMDEQTNQQGNSNPVPRRCPKEE
jgi:hypothetical protein